MDVPQILLGSASPRRAELLRRAGLSFRIERPDVDESLASDVAPEDAAVLLAERKGRAVARRHAREDVLVIAADTIVALDALSGATLLGKPANESEARAMLSSLSGTRHRVITGVAVAGARHALLESSFECTWVTMRAITASEIDDYARSGEWRDKAGGYAIQETADRFVTGLSGGGFDNVVGLPVALTLRLLERVRALAALRARG